MGWLTGAAGGGSGGGGLLIRRDQFLEPGVLQTDVVPNTAVVQNVSGERRADAAGERPPVEQVREPLRRVADRAVDRDVRVELGLGHADDRGLGGGVAL